MSIVAFEGSDGKQHYALAYTVGEVEEAFYSGGYADGYTAGHEAGLEESHEAIDAAEAECSAKHFVGFVDGDGSETLSVTIPFEPDIISICAADAAAVKAMSVADDCGYAYHLVLNTKTTDEVSGQMLGGAMNVVNKGGYAVGNMSMSKYSRQEDGAVAFSNIQFGTSGQYIALFAAGQKYIVVAEKHTGD